MMSEKNVHTSVVIELANQMESNYPKMYQIDFNELNSSKDYVLDQIFSGENVTVYALFESPEDTNSLQYDKKFLHVDNSGVHTKVSFSDPSESKKITIDNDLSNFNMRFNEKSKNICKKESYFCFKHFDEPEASCRNEELDMKILYSKKGYFNGDKRGDANEAKMLSKGVNTDIVLNPKLMDKVHEAININFSSSSCSKKTLENSTASSQETYLGTSSSSVINENNQVSPNYLLVPLVMMEDGRLSYYKKELKCGCRKTSFNSKCCEPCEKVNNRIITNLNFNEVEENNGQKTKEVKSNQACTSLFDQRLDHSEKSAVMADINNKSPLLCHEREIIEEIKDMQLKLNTILKSLQHNSEAENLNERELKIESRILLKSNKPMSNTSDEPIQKTDIALEVPYFSEIKSDDEFDAMNELPLQSVSQTLVNVSPLHFTIDKEDKKIEQEKEEIEVENFENSGRNLTRSITVTWSESSLLTHLTHDLLSKISDIDKNDDFEFFDMDAKKYLRNTVGAPLIKSDAHFQSKVVENKHSLNQVLKRSQSLDLNHEKMESGFNKKIKTLFFKPELNQKPNGRMHQTMENVLDDLTLNKCEVGNEIKTAIKTSHGEIISEHQGEKIFDKSEKDNPETSLEIHDSEIKTNKKKPFQKQQMALPRLFDKNDNFPENLCNTTVESTLVKNPKNHSLFTDKMPLKTLKANSESDRQSFAEIEKHLNLEQKIDEARQSLLKKEKVKGTERTAIRKTIEKSGKVEKKDLVSEVEKPKPFSRNVKSPRTAIDSKKNADKLNKNSLITNSKIRSENSFSMTKPRVSTDGKIKGKNEECSTRPSSQKRKKESNALNENREKKRKNALKKNSKSSLEKILENDKSGHFFIFDKKTQNVIIAKNSTMLDSNCEIKSLKSSPVLVELCSKKPSSVEKEDTESHKTVCKRSIKCAHSTGHECSTQIENWTTSSLESKESDCKMDDIMKQNEELEKSIVKSVWALTKVLLYKDGSKNFEVLESLSSSPDYS